MKLRFIACGLFLMLVDAYLDNMRGPLLPVVTRVLSLPYGLSSWFFAAGNFASFFCVLLFIPLSHRFSDRKIAIGVCLLGIVCTMICTHVGGFVSLAVLATFWGSAVASFGAISNLLVLKGTDEKHRARYFCGLHMMYGFGSVIAPGLAGFMVESGYQWYSPLLICLPIFILLAVYFAWLFPHGSKADGVERRRFRLNRAQTIVVVTFATYVGAEVMVSAWMVTYLTDFRHLPLSLAARYLTGFFLVMGTTRLLCFLTLPPALERVVLAGSLVLSAFFFCLGHLGALWGFSLAGILGPFFPLLLARTTKAFPADAHNLTIAVLAGLQVALVPCHLLLGGVTDRLGIEASYLLSLPLIGITLAGLWLYTRAEAGALGLSRAGTPVYPRAR